MSSEKMNEPDSPRRTEMRERIVAAALALADAEGIRTVTMRRLAAELGLGGPMTLYHYVASKQELIYLVSDAIGAELLVPGAVPAQWRDALRAIAHRTLAAFERHPWLLDAGGRDPVATPNMLRHVQQSAEAVAGLDLDPATATAMVMATDDYTIGCVARRRFHARAREFPHVTSAVDLRPEVRAVLESGELPLVSAWLAEGGALELPEDSFEVGLEWLFDGMEAMLARRRG